MAPRNYPFQLLVSLLTGCIRGGKCILQTAAWIDPAVKYPPYQELKWLKWFFK